MVGTQAGVNTGDMRDGANVIAQTSVDIDGVRGQVVTTVETLMGTWQADAASIFQSAMDSFNQTCRDITARLDGLATDVRSAADEYDGRSEENTHLARNVAATVEAQTPGLLGFDK